MCQWKDETHMKLLTNLAIYESNLTNQSSWAAFTVTCLVWISTYQLLLFLWLNKICYDFNFQKQFELFINYWAINRQETKRATKTLNCFDFLVTKRMICILSKTFRKMKINVKSYYKSSKFLFLLFRNDKNLSSNFK